MCGLVGMAGALDHTHKAAFKDFLTVAQLRGRDSTGVFAVSPDGLASSVKNVGTPEWLVEHKVYDTHVGKGQSMVMAGHCRAKTYGEVSVKNAHPFDFPGLVGMHNGTLRNHHTMEKYRDYDTDSETLLWNVNEYGPEETFSKLHADGAWACVWWDKKEDTLNFLRNKERSLWFTWTKDSKVMLWASEIWMFGAVYRNPAISLWDGGEEKQLYYQLPEDTLWSFKLNHAPKQGEKSITMRPMKEIKAEVKTYAGNFTQRGRHGNSGDDWVVVNGVWGPAKGGEVANPFRGKEEINDPLPLHLLPAPKQEITQEESTTIVTIEQTSSKTSLLASASKVDLTHGTSSPKPTLSLVSKSLRNGVLDNNEGVSKPSGKYVSTNQPPKRGVSIRKFKDLVYITDMKTSAEFSIQDFEKNTKGVCTHCKEPIGDISEVYEFINKDNFICTTCVKEPKKIVA